MAITNVAQYAHLNESDMEALGAELDTIRRDIEESRGAHDATYIRRTIAFQRALEAGARLLIATSRAKAGWIVGTVALAFAKCVENMEIGHNVGHGQWDWMNDPEIHSTTWEWDMAGLSSQWRYSHNYRHHVFTNVLDMDDDLGFGVMRLTRDQPWQPRYLMQPLRNLVLAIGFEWGIARHGVHAAQARAVTASEKSAQSRAVVTKITRQMSKDYLIFPALSRSRWRRTLGANVAANVMRNLWAYVVIFCGHFPDGAEKFSGAVVEQESKPDWYLRQMLGTANFDAGPLMAFASGNLCYQIEHHLFPDLPSNRYAQIAIRVRALCEKFDLPYTTGSLLGQYLQTVRTIHKLALPDRFLDRRLRDGVKRHVGQNFLRTAGQTSISDQAARPATADRPRSDSASGADGVNVVRRTVRKCRGGRSKSPADEQPASHMPESDRDDDRVGPAHVPGAGRGESKS